MTDAVVAETVRITWSNFVIDYILQLSRKRNPCDHEAEELCASLSGALQQFYDRSAQETTTTHTVVDKKHGTLEIYFMWQKPLNIAIAKYRETEKRSHCGGHQHS